jgi:hypothetical protein
MERMVSCCGLICTDCKAYQATQAGDEARLAQVAAEWREEYKNPVFNATNVACDGCVALTKRHCAHWYACGTRKCASEHGAANCGACSEYASCEKIQSFFQYVPSAKVVLDEIHAAKS